VALFCVESRKCEVDTFLMTYQKDGFIFVDVMQDLGCAYQSDRDMLYPEW